MSDTTRRYLALTFCFLERLLFAGTAFSWPSLVYVLQEDGVYSHLCIRTDNTSVAGNGSMVHHTLSNGSHICTAQRVRLSLGYTIAVLAGGVGTIAAGFILDKWGVLVIRSIGTASGAVSFLCFGFVNKGIISGIDWVVFIGAFLLGVSCFSLVMTTIHLAVLAKSKASLVNSLFSGTLMLPLTFQCVKVAYDNGIARVYSFIFLSAAWILFFFLSLNYLPRFKANRNGEFVQRNDIEKTDDPGNIQDQKPTAYQREMFKSMKKPKSRYPLLDEVKHYVLGWRYILFVFFFSCLHVRIADISSSYNDWISSVVGGNKAKVSYYTDVLAYTSMAATIICFLPGLAADYLRKIWKGEDSSAMFCAPIFTTISFLAAATSIPIYMNTEYSIYIYVILYAIFKQTFYCGVTPFFSLVLPIHIYGMLFAIIESVAGLSALFIYLYAIWTVNTNSYIPVTTYHVILSLLTLSLPIKIVWDWKCRKSKVSNVTILDHIIKRSTTL